MFCSPPRCSGTLCPALAYRSARKRRISPPWGWACSSSWLASRASCTCRGARQCARDTCDGPVCVGCMRLRRVGERMRIRRLSAMMRFAKSKTFDHTCRSKHSRARSRPAASSPARLPFAGAPPRSESTFCSGLASRSQDMCTFLHLRPGACCMPSPRIRFVESARSTLCKECCWPAGPSRAPRSSSLPRCGRILCSGPADRTPRTCTFAHPLEGGIARSSPAFPSSCTGRSTPCKETDLSEASSRGLPQTCSSRW